MPTANPIQELIDALVELDQQVGGDPSLLNEEKQLERIIGAARPVLAPFYGNDSTLIIFTARSRNLQFLIGKYGGLYEWQPGSPFRKIGTWHAIKKFGFTRIVNGLARTVRREIKKSRRNSRVAAGALRDIRSASRLAASD